jgi:hypothetical protein
MRAKRVQFDCTLSINYSLTDGGVGVELGSSGVDLVRVLEHGGELAALGRLAEHAGGRGEHLLR